MTLNVYLIAFERQRSIKFPLSPHQSPGIFFKQKQLHHFVLHILVAHFRKKKKKITHMKFCLLSKGAHLTLFHETLEKIVDEKVKYCLNLLTSKNMIAIC